MLTKRTFLTAVAAGAVTAMVPSVATAAKSWTLTFSTVKRNLKVLRNEI